jgi:lipopolysaccharide transport protein LptA
MNGTLHARNVILRQAPSTLISAAETSARGLAESYENSHWEFKGSVHIEYEGTILDADAATVTFADNHIRRIHVTGSPARFSHQPKKSERRNEGRAGTIDYDAAKVQVRLAGGTWYSDGRNEVRTAVLVYNTTDGSFTTQDGSGESDRVSMTIRPGTRVPPPRTPERETAQ